MRTLILVRHSESKLDPAIPPHQWVLTAEGRQLCVPLAARLADYNPRVIVTSEEVKARETGEIVAEILDVPWFTAPGIQEHHRERGEIFRQRDWMEMVAKLFKHLDELVFGLETGDQARKRFSTAVQSVMQMYPGGNIALVSHGTVMSLYYGSITGKDPYRFWRQLGLPAFYALSWPAREVLSIMEDITI